MPPPPPPPPGVAAPKPPPFPVVAPPKTGKTTPPIPHISAHTEPPMPASVVFAKAPWWKKKIFLIGGGAAALTFLAAGSWFVFRPKPPPPLPPKANKVAVAAPAPPAASPAAVKSAAPTGPALSETESAIAHAPVNAINKAKDVAAKRVGSGQGRDAIGEITDEDTPAAKSAAKAPAPPVATSSTIAPGISATNGDITAAAEASPAFRLFVANAKINGVFPTATPPRIMLNGRLVRGGDMVESTLAITFDSVDAEKKLLIFKDKSGATVSHRY
jgi:hypothetical protein